MNNTVPISPNPQYYNITKSLRSQCIHKLNEITNNHNLSQQIENSVYEFFVAFMNENYDNISKLKSSIYKKMYLAKLEQIYHLLKPNSYIKYNTSQLLNDKTKIANIANIHYKELCPEKWKLLEPDLKILDQKITNNDENIYTTDAFTCNVCNENSCVYCEVQVKSCDENATIFVRCLKCSNCFRA